MSLLLDDIHDYLAANVGNSTGWLLFKSYMPDDQDQCVAIFETGGMPADTMERENERVTFQVCVRGSRFDYVTVRQKWQDLFEALQDSLPATGYILVQAMSYAPLVWNDPSGRINMSSNWRVTRLHSLSQ